MTSPNIKAQAGICLLLLLIPFVILDDVRRQVILSPKGSIRGAESKTKGVFQYSIRYAQPPVGSLRWRDPVPIERWNSIYDATNTPPVCPQANPSPFVSMSEDCLFLTVYSPEVEGKQKLPILVWVHGGSYLEGSAQNYGLDGSALAGKTKMVVVVIQYRLGLLGFLRGPTAKTNPPISGNYAVKDVIMALNFVQDFADTFGGDRKKVTLGGQSSGADMIKTLLVTKSASGLFQRAILQSAPLNYADHSIRTAEAIGSIAVPLFNCQDDCFRTSLDLDTILEVQNSLVGQIPNQLPEVAPSTPFRPVVDNVLINTDFIRAVNSPGSNDSYFANRQILFTTVKDEAGPTIADKASQLKSVRQVPQIIQGALGSLDTNRSSALQASGIYNREFNLDFLFRGKIEASKDILTLFGTDYIWRCANQQAAVNLTRNFPTPGGGNSIWLAEFDLGIPYPSTQSIPYCLGKVCHEDDILAVFGVPKDYPRFLSYFQRKLIAEVGARWAAFAATGSPNANGYAPWPPVSSRDQLNLLRLGGKLRKISPDQRPWACREEEGVWGTKIRFDAQITSNSS